MSIFPYIYYMIEDFHITNHSSKISVYAGMVTSAFTLAEFATGVLWGRLSDKIGRKPVLLFGLAGTALSVLIFGFAPNLPVALIARALGGLLNGFAVPQPESLLLHLDYQANLESSNIGVLQTTVAELVTVKEQQRKFCALQCVALQVDGWLTCIGCSESLHYYANGVVAITLIFSDIAVLELFLPLLCGASIVLAQAPDISTPKALLGLMRQYHITTMQTTPII